MLPAIPKYTRLLNTDVQYRMISNEVSQSLALLPDPCQVKYMPERILLCKRSCWYILKIACMLY